MTVIDIIKDLLMMVVNNSWAYYLFITGLCIQIVHQTIVKGDISVPGIYFIIMLTWKIYRMRQGYKSFSFKLIKNFFSSKPSKDNSKKETNEHKGYDLIDK